MGSSVATLLLSGFQNHYSLTWHCIFRFLRSQLSDSPFCCLRCHFMTVLEFLLVFTCDLSTHTLPFQQTVVFCTFIRLRLLLKCVCAHPPTPPATTHTSALNRTGFGSLLLCVWMWEWIKSDYFFVPQNTVSNRGGQPSFSFFFIICHEFDLGTERMEFGEK